MGVIGHYILKAILAESVVGTSVGTVSQVAENCACVLLRLAHVSRGSALRMRAAPIARHALRTQEMIHQQEPQSGVYCCDL